MMKNGVLMVFAALTILGAGGAAAEVPLEAPPESPKAGLATGTFEVKLTPQPSETGLGRLALDKTFKGNLEATSRGEMLSALGEVGGSAGYVAMEKVTGRLGGKSGSFVLQHSGTMDRGTPTLVVTVVPDSGTGELAGISGKMNIRITAESHFYDFEYSLDRTPPAAAP